MTGGSGVCTLGITKVSAAVESFPPFFGSVMASAKVAAGSAGRVLVRG
jgi:hypothetical protein